MNLFLEQESEILLEEKKTSREENFGEKSELMVFGVKRGEQDFKPHFLHML